MTHERYFSIKEYERPVTNILIIEQLEAINYSI